MVKDNNCALCGAKLISRGKIIKEFSTQNFGKEGKKASIKPICSDCKNRVK